MSESGRQSNFTLSLPLPPARDTPLPPSQIPSRWSTMPFFAQTSELEGIPVINIHLWFDRKLESIDGLCFSRSPLLSVYADMSTCCRE